MKAGDTVEVVTSDETISGLLLPRPDILSQDIVVVKLDNGYNIGIDKSRISSIKVLQKSVPKPKKVFPKRVFQKNLPTVAILSTGGTISSRIDYTTGAVKATDTAEDFLAMWPELENIANIRVRSIMQVMSEDMGPSHWLAMAREAIKELKTADGVVIAHGTDILHFTSAALSMLIQNLNKPIIVTGSQRSIDRGSSDAFMNLLCSVIAASKFDCAEVMTCLHGSINDDFCSLIRGTKVRKMHTSRRDAFRPINDLSIAQVFPDGRIEVTNSNYRKKTVIPMKLRSFDERVALIQIFPNMDAGVIDYYLKKGVKGFVLAATALGHVPTFSKKTLIPFIKRAAGKGVPVVIATQSLYGRVHPYVYTNLRRLSIESGCVFVDDMLPEAAYIKLMIAVAECKGVDVIKKFMQSPLAGEITEREVDDTFLQ